jgi:phosphatidylglycerol---prolipoprotein diacylglyceryl transferase
MNQFIKKYIPFLQDGLSIRLLAILILLISIVVATLLFQPLSMVFSGQWKLQQQFELINIPALNLFGLELPIGQINIRYYSLFILSGLLSGYFLSLFIAQKQYVAGTIIDRLLIGILIFGLLGARILYVAFNWSLFIESPGDIVLGLSQGGLAIFGAFIGSFLYLWYYTSRFHFNLYEFLDVIIPGVLLGQIIGRWGNFFNYEAYGPSTSVIWKMFVPDMANISSNLNDRFFHPTFLYEIIPNIFLLIFILYFYTNLTRRHAGRVFGVYAMGYGLIRFITEFFRLDALYIDLPFTIQIGLYESKKLLISQVLALFLILIGIIVYNHRNKIIYKKREMGEMKFS